VVASRSNRSGLGEVDQEARGDGVELPDVPEREGAQERVIGFLSSFAQMPGGNPYPELMPATDVKPLRIFLQAGHSDLDWNEPEGNWLANNLRVTAALAEAGYFRLVLGDGGHSPNYGGVLLPDALRWAFRASSDQEPEEAKVFDEPASHALDEGRVCLLGTGAPGTGKTTVTGLLARLLSRSAVISGDTIARLVVGR